MNGNYIKINRKILDWEWYGNINTKVLFLHMLLKANWKQGKFEGKIIEKGSFVSSIPKLALETDLTAREIRTAIEHLKATGELTAKSNSKYTVFTINNYCSYQVSDTQNGSQSTDERHSNDILLTGKRHSNDRLTTTIEEVKKGRREEFKEEEEGKKKDIKDIVAPSKAVATFPENSFEMICVNTLIHSCLDNFPASKVPTTEVEKTIWCDHIEKMKRLDHRSEEDIKEAMKFAITDQFWKSNIRSTKKFREKFETLLLQSKNKKPNKAPVVRQERHEKLRKWAEDGE